jgi:hypothetical protein
MLHPSAATRSQKLMSVCYFVRKSLPKARAPVLLSVLLRLTGAGIALLHSK